MRRKHRTLLPLDFLVAVYSAFTLVLFVLFPGRTSSGTFWIAFNLVVFLLVMLASFVDPEQQRPVIRILRLFYPAFLFIFFYEEAGSLVFVFFDGWFDGAIVAAEHWMFGFQPAVDVEKLYHPILNEIIIACYVSYYLWLPAALILLLRSSKSNEAYRVLTASTMAFFCSYVIFMLYPAEGPRYYLADSFNSAMSGVAFVPFVNYVMDKAAVHGGAMPSSHTAVAVIVWIYAWKNDRTVALFLLPVLTGLMVGCVWGRFHYVLDVIVGIALGLAASLATRWLFASGAMGADRLSRRPMSPIVRTEFDSTRSQ